MLGALTIEQLYDSLAVRIDGLSAAGATACIDWVLSDLVRTYLTELSNGALIHADAGYGGGVPNLRITLSKPRLVEVLGTGNLDGVAHVGRDTALLTILGMLDHVDHGFPIVTP